MSFLQSFDYFLSGYRLNGDEELVANVYFSISYICRLICALDSSFSGCLILTCLVFSLQPCFLELYKNVIVCPICRVAKIMLRADNEIAFQEQLLWEAYRVITWSEFSLASIFVIIHILQCPVGLPWRLSGKESTCNAEDAGDVGLIPGLGRFPGGGHDNTLPYSCLENPMDRGAWWAMVCGVSKSWTQLKRLCIHTHTHIHIL